MTFEFFRFELREQLRSPLLWLMAGLFALMTGYALMMALDLALG